MVEPIELITKEELSDPHQSLHLMMQLVCSRPWMWVGDETFKSVVIYLSGYDAAVANLTEGKDMLWQSDLARFGRWLKRKTSASSGTGPPWDQRAWFVVIEELYPDDETRLRQLPELFGEYLREQGQSSATV